MFSRNNSATYIKANQSKVKDEERIGAEQRREPGIRFIVLKKTTTFAHIRTIYPYSYLYIYAYKTPKNRGCRSLLPPVVGAGSEQCFFFITSCESEAVRAQGAGPSQPGHVQQRGRRHFRNPSSSKSTALVQIETTTCGLKTSHRALVPKHLPRFGPAAALLTLRPLRSSAVGGASD